MKLLVINGSNINMLGIREKDIYGNDSFDKLENDIFTWACDMGIRVEMFQSNHEGAIVDKIQEAYGNFDGIIINPAAYTHTSIAILDALKAVGIPTVEVHISDIDNREKFRVFSYVSLYAEKIIKGHGLLGYKEAMEYFVAK